MKELAIDGVIYAEMEDDETAQDAIERLEKLFEENKICLNDSYTYDVQEL